MAKKRKRRVGTSARKGARKSPASSRGRRPVRRNPESAAVRRLYERMHSYLEKAQEAENAGDSKKEERYKDLAGRMEYKAEQLAAKEERAARLAARPAGSSKGTKRFSFGEQRGEERGRNEVEYAGRGSERFSGGSFAPIRSTDASLKDITRHTWGTWTPKQKMIAGGTTLAALYFLTRPSTPTA